MNTALDTSGNSFCLDPSYLERFDRLMDLTDLFLLDIKAVDASLHKQLTGQDNAGILALAPLPGGSWEILVDPKGTGAGAYGF